MSRYAGKLPTTYAEAEQALKGRPVRTILNNTRVSRQDEDTIEVQYHGNTIATFSSDGSKELTTCGWNTSSTRQRLNAMLWGEHIGFVQHQYVGYIEVGLASGERERHHADTIEIQPSGSINSITNSREA